MISFRVFLVAIGAIATSACETIGERAVDAYTPDDNTTNSRSFEYADLNLPKPFNLDCSRTEAGVTYVAAAGFDWQGQPVCPSDDTAPSPPPHPITKRFSQALTKEFRNDLGNHLIRSSNKLCESHLAAFGAIADGAEIGLRETSLILSTLGGLLEGKTAQILSATSALVQSTDSNLSEVVLAKQLMPVVATAIRSARQTKYEQIQKNLDSPPSKYSAAKMVTEIDAYHQLCSFKTGVAILMEKANEPATEPADDKKTKTKKKTTTSDTAPPT